MDTWMKWPWRQKWNLSIGPSACSLLTTADLSTASSETSTCQQRRPILSSYYVIIPLGDYVALWWKVDYTGIFPSWTGQQFYLMEIDYLFWVYICISYQTIFIQHHYLGTYKMQGPHMWNIIQCSIQAENHFTAKVLQEGTSDHGFHWLYHMLHIPEAAGLIEHWNGLLGVQFKHQLGNNTQQEWGAVPQDAIDLGVAAQGP